ncbi:hypothetical protein TRFO_39736 [Tritrichomonas foetus]|uniref:Uncharacterized protein n=1 Tax=Tritrichomonas foetus TaxID=1144522 RepID=A0A1J4J9G9_9EUKA|nr:hypothetical protein TRFO_39736 [Tritrichomonas foetus]|eukprot:OHS94069.1 hypothetical protein TRFO_39736 [Tritrichomonas foetus]
MTRIQFSPDQVLALFIPSPPPPGTDAFLSVFSPECQEPLDQSLFRQLVRAKNAKNKNNKGFQNNNTNANPNGANPNPNNNKSNFQPKSVKQQPPPPTQNAQQQKTEFQPVSATSQNEQSSNPPQNAFSPQTSNQAQFNPVVIPPQAQLPQVPPIPQQQDDNQFIFQPQLIPSQPNFSMHQQNQDQMNFIPQQMNYPEMVQTPVNQAQMYQQQQYLQNVQTGMQIPQQIQQSLQPQISGQPNFLQQPILSPTLLPNVQNIQNVPVQQFQQQFQPQFQPQFQQQYQQQQQFTSPQHQFPSNVQQNIFAPSLLPSNQVAGNAMMNPLIQGPSQPQQPQNINSANILQQNIQSPFGPVIVPQENMMNQGPTFAPLQEIQHNPTPTRNSFAPTLLPSDDQPITQNIPVVQQQPQITPAQLEPEPVQQPQIIIQNNPIHETVISESFESVLNKEITAQEKEHRQSATNNNNEANNKNQKIEANWTNNNNNQKGGRTQVSVNDILASETKRKETEQVQSTSIERTSSQEKKIPAWEAPQTTAKPASIDALFAEESRKNSNKQQHQQPAPKVPKKGGKKVVMSFQELQRELNKPAQWGSPQTVTNPPVPSMDEIIKKATSTTKSSEKQNVGVVGGKKGKQKKTVMQLQDFNRMNMEEERSNNPTPSKKSLNVPSMNALIESEKNKESRPPPTSAPVTKRSNHRGRGKEVIDPSTLQTAPAWGSNTTDTSKPTSFSAIASMEAAKSNAGKKPEPSQQAPPPQTKKGKKAKKQVMTLQEFVRPTQTTASVWDAPAPANNPKSKKISFTELQKQQATSNNTNTKPQQQTTHASQIQQPSKQQQQEINLTPVTTSSATTSAVQSSKKKKKGRNVPLDEFLKSQQPSSSGTQTNWGANKNKNSRFASSSDDDDYPRRPNPAKKSMFDKLREEELRKKSKAQNISHITTVGSSQKKQAAAFSQLLDQERIHEESGAMGGEVNLIDDLGDIKGIRNQQQQHNVYNQSNKNNNTNNYSGNNRNNKNKKKQQKDEDEDDLFWGAASPEEVQNMDEEEYPSFSAQKPKRQTNTKKALTPAEFLAQLIEDTMYDGEDYYEFAEILTNKTKTDMIRSLQTIVDSHPKAIAIADKYFRRFPR